MSPIFFGASGDVPGASTIVTLIVPVRPPYDAVTVTVWFAVTVGAVRTPPVLIVAYRGAALHVGLTAVVVPLFHVAVAVYVPVPPSFTDDGPLTAMLVSVAATFTTVTARVAVRVTPPLV